MVKCLFLFARYYSLALVCAVSQQYTLTLQMCLVLALFTAPWDRDTCDQLQRLKPSLTIASTLAVEIILALRVVSIWGNNRGVIAAAFALVTSVAVTQSIFASRAVAMQLPPGILACVSSFAPDDMVGKGAQLALCVRNRALRANAAATSCPWWPIPSSCVHALAAV